MANQEHPRRRRQTLARPEIVAAALAIADRAGLEAVSMRRVADELGVATMTLYHHVSDKDELVELMSDAISAETLVPEPLPDGWRAALRAISCQARDTFRRHPWVLEALGARHRMTLNGLRHVEQSAQAVAELQSAGDLGLRLLFAADDYTIGFVTRELMLTHLRSAGEAPFEISPAIGAAIESGEFPLVSQWLKAGAELELPADRFEVGLEALFDGFEARAARLATLER